MVNQKLVYLSGPISNGGTATQDQIEANIDASIPFHSALMKARFAVINPILTAYVDEMHEIDWNIWVEADLTIVVRCDAVLRLPGPSKGADMECEYARKRWIPVFHSVEDLIAWRDSVDSIIKGVAFA